MVFLMVIVFMRYLNYEVPSILTYTLGLLGALYFLSIFKSWWKYK